MRQNLSPKDPLHKLAMVARAVLLFWIVLIILTILFLVFASPSAKANDDLLLNGKTEVHINRPLSVIIVDDMAELRRLCNDYSTDPLYGCAPNWNGKGRCINYLFYSIPAMARGFHELQHCAGETHPTPQHRAKS